MRTTKDMDFIFDLEGTEISIEMQQKEIRKEVKNKKVKNEAFIDWESHSAKEF